MKSITLGIIAAASLHAAAEPIVLRFEGGVRSVQLRSIDPAMPPVSLAEWPFLGGGQLDVYPQLFPSGINDDSCPTPPFLIEQATGAAPGPARYDATPIGASVDAGIEGWAPAFACVAFEIDWPRMLIGTPDVSCDLPGCPEDVGLGWLVSPGVAVVPIRLSAAEVEWHYAWLAFRFEEIVHPDCSFCGDNPPVDLVTGAWSVIGFGYETVPGTPIINGGGLCEADLTLDAILDLADIGAFVAAFIAADPAGDLNDDGVFDLADIQRFVTGFNTGCGL